MWNPFKSSSVTQVATQVSRVIPDTGIVDGTQASVIKALFNDGNMAEYILEDMIAGIGMRADAYYRYGESKYTYGLPSGSYLSSTQGKAAVEAVIEDIENQQVFVEYSYFGPLNPLHMGWKKLLEDHGYDTNTNQLGNLTSSKSTPVWLKDMQVVVPKASYESLDVLQLEQWGVAPCAGYTPERLVFTGDVTMMVPHSPIITSNVATDVHLLVTYVWQVTGHASLDEATFTIPLTAFDLNAEYFQAKYVVNGTTKYWVYKNKTGVYPTLDQVYVDAEAVNGTYFPIAYFRYNKASTTADTSTEAFKTTKKMLKALGMDYVGIADGINENPSIADVEQAMMIFAVPPVSTNAVENRYLFDYFDTLYNAYGSSSSAILDKALSKFTQMSGVSGRSSESHTTIIKDKLFQMAFTTGAIHKRMVAGSIGAVGTYTSALVEVSASQTFSDENGTYSAVVPTKVNKYRHQLLPGLYEEITVDDLKMTYYIWGGYTTTGDDGSEILLIPIDRSITKNYQIKERQELYSRALHFVFNSRTTVEVKWYQQSWFQVFLIVVAVYFTIQTGGSDGGKAVAAALGLEGAAAMIAIVIFDVMVMGALFGATFKVFVKLAGKDVATLLAIAAMVYGGYQLAEKGMAGVPTAQNMLMLSTGLQQAVLYSDFADLMEEGKMFEAESEEKTKLLDTAKELLHNQTLLSPFTIFGEKPEDYFNRTVHYGNIGTLGITAISSYVDMALTLPKVQDTLGEPLNG